MVSHNQADQGGRRVGENAEGDKPKTSRSKAAKALDAAKRDITPESAPPRRPSARKPPSQAAPSTPESAPAPRGRTAKKADATPDLKPIKPAAMPADSPKSKASRSKGAKALDAAKKGAAAPKPADAKPANAAEGESKPKPSRTRAAKALEAAKRDVTPKPSSPVRPAAGRKPAAKAGESSPSAAAKPTRRTASAGKAMAAASIPPQSKPESQPASGAEPGPESGRTPAKREAKPPQPAGKIQPAYVHPAPPEPPEPSQPAPPGGSKVVLMIRDPEWIYAYWEISLGDRAAHAIGQPQGAPPLLLRVHDLGAGAEPVEAGNTFDVTIIPDASGWYVHVPYGGGHWRVALGYLDYEGNLVTLAQSNVVTTPSPIQAAWNEQTWGPVAEEMTMLEASAGIGAPSWQTPAAGGGATAGAGGAINGQSQLVQRASRLMEYLRRMGSSEQFLRPGASEQFPRPGASEQLPLRPGASEQYFQVGASEQFLRPGASEQFARPGASEQFLRPGASEQFGVQPGAVGLKEKTFWLQVYTELIVYGATEPDAQVTVQGQPVRLRPDGTFTLRYALPDGEQVIPVHAVNADGDMERTITPIVRKRTV